MITDELLRPPALSDPALLDDADVVVEIIAGTATDAADAALAARPIEEAITASYQALAGGIATTFVTVAVLEEAPRRSLSIWMRAQLARNTREQLAGADDASLLKYLAQGTATILAWMEGSDKPRFTDLERALRVLAWGTAATSQPAPPLPRSSDLMKTIAAWQMVKDALLGAESARIIIQRRSSPLDLQKLIGDPGAYLLDKKMINRGTEMIVVVQSPDYQRTGKWQLKFGESLFTANCEPGTVLDGFYKRELDIRPGDALHCTMQFETSYGDDHEVLSENATIMEVREVLPTSIVDANLQGEA